MLKPTDRTENQGDTLSCRAPLGRKKRLGAFLVRAVEEPLRSNVVESLVLNHSLRLEAWMIRVFSACLQPDTVAVRSVQGKPPRVARIPQWQERGKRGVDNERLTSTCPVLVSCTSLVHKDWCED